MTPLAQKAIVWGLVGLGAYLVLKRIMAARSIKPYAGAGGGASDGTFGGTFGGVTAPDLTVTPTGPTHNGNPAGVPITMMGTQLYQVGSTGSYGVAGSTAADLNVGLYPTTTPRSKTDQTRVLGVNIPGMPGKTQGPTLAQQSEYATFHAHDAAVIAQQAAESNNVSAAQRGKGIPIGTRSDGTPFLMYR